MPHSFSDFCAKVFMCRWDKAVVNITLMFALCMLVVLAGKHMGVFFSSPSLINDVLTGAIATTMGVVVGVLRKKSIL